MNDSIIIARKNNLVDLGAIIIAKLVYPDIEYKLIDAYNPLEIENPTIIYFKNSLKEYSFELLRNSSLSNGSLRIQKKDLYEFIRSIDDYGSNHKCLELYMHSVGSQKFIDHFLDKFSHEYFRLDLRSEKRDAYSDYSDAQQKVQLINAMFQEQPVIIFFDYKYTDLLLSHIFKVRSNSNIIIAFDIQNNIIKIKSNNNLELINYFNGIIVGDVLLVQPTKDNLELIKQGLSDKDKKIFKNKIKSLTNNDL
ncbi:MAG: hypothetical protein R3Y21_04290 [Mycoplasmatota bacterium]